MKSGTRPDFDGFQLLAEVAPESGLRRVRDLARILVNAVRKALHARSPRLRSGRALRRLKATQHNGLRGEQGAFKSGPAGYRFARSRLMMSSEVITPVNFLLSSTTGSVSRLYLSNNSATSFSFAPAWVEIRGSCVSASMGVSGVASTSLASGTAPARVPWESTR